jgi:hypothetical protein
MSPSRFFRPRERENDKGVENRTKLFLDGHQTWTLAGIYQYDKKCRLNYSYFIA